MMRGSLFVVALFAVACDVCGNGFKDREECDDGNVQDGDGCSSRCELETNCGNDRIDSDIELEGCNPNFDPCNPEECDDGNTLSGDGCDSNCTITRCGNEIATPGEECDDGNVQNGDGCDEGCIVSICGNGVRAAGLPSFASFPVGLGAGDIAMGDLNGDGAPDALVASVVSPDVVVLLGDGAGGFSQPFSPINIGLTPRDIALGDIDEDGDLDALIASFDFNDESNPGDVRILVGDGAGGFSQPSSPIPVGLRPGAIALEDFNRDGHLDAIVSNGGANNVSLLVGDGAGGFSQPFSPIFAGSQPGDIAVGDINGDGRPDAVVANASGVGVLVPDEALGFVSGGSIPTGPGAVELEDTNEDGFLDLIIASPSSSIVGIFLGDGSLSFNGITPEIFAVGSFPIDLRLADLNDDGRVDILTANGSQELSLLVGDNSGGFTLLPPIFAGDAVHRIETEDVDGDGHPEVITTGFNGVGVVFVSPIFFEGEECDDGNLVEGDGCDSNCTVTACGNGIHSENDILVSFSPVDFSPRDLALADINGTGGLDVITANTGSSATVLLGGSAGFVRLPVLGTGVDPSGIALGDINDDGLVDMLAASATGTAAFLGNGAGGFTIASLVGAEVSGASRRVALGNIDEDERIDALTVNPDTNDVRMLAGDGAGGFTGPFAPIPVGSVPTDVEIGHINGNEFTDAITANFESNDVTILLDVGLGGVIPISIPVTGFGPIDVELGDVNGDGRMDAVTANAHSGDVTVLLGDEFGDFTARPAIPVFGNPFQVELGDLNGDGRLDIVTANANNVSVLLGDGVGGFAPFTTFAVGEQPSSVELGDINGDDRLDIVTANFGSGDVSVIIVSGAFFADEECDDGNTLSGDGCDSLCRLETPCGDGVEDSSLGEECDDGNTLSGDGCDSNCTITRCGNGILTLGEECDKGDLIDNDGCDSNCTVTRCGNGVATPGEICDDGNQSNGDGCRADCAGIEICGDGQLDAINAEQCDDGNLFEGDGCDSDCAPSACGNGIVASAFTPLATADVGGVPVSVAIGDINNDSHADLLVVNFFDDDVDVLLGDGAGGFTLLVPVPVGFVPEEIAIADLNGDSRLDALVANSFSNDVSILIGDGAGGFTQPFAPVATGGGSFNDGFDPSRVEIADLNGDGSPDAVTANTTPGTMSVLLNAGDGNLTASAPIAVGDTPRDIALGDINGDGLQDAVTANGGSDDLGILVGNGAGGFTLLAPASLGVGASGPVGLALGDVNGDGLQDALTANIISGNVSVLVGNGAGGFAPLTLINVGVGGPETVALNDINGDGNLDALVAAISGDVVILLGVGDGGFTVLAPIAVGESPRSLALGDINGDGLQDAATANDFDATVSVLLNNLLSANEECDDGNTLAGDGCDESCQRETNCGNGLAEAGEECDLNDLLGQSCASQGFDVGTLGCASDCQLDTSACQSLEDSCVDLTDNDNDSLVDCADLDCTLDPACVCGNGVVTFGESCDDGNTQDGDGCSSLCQPEALCGNGLIEANEDCEGQNLAGETCRTLGFPSGLLSCDSSCQFVLSSCSAEICDNGFVDDDGDNIPDCEDVDCRFLLPCSCGNGLLDLEEDCDGANLAGASCQSLGFDSGSLFCGLDNTPQACLFNTSGCEELEDNCQNNQDDDGNSLVDCEDPDCDLDPACVEDCTNGLDDDGDAAVDCADGACAAAPGCATPELCQNNQDDDGDGEIDCADLDCAGDLACTAGFVCEAGQTLLQISSTDIPKAIPDANTLGVSSLVNVGTNGAVQRVVLRLDQLTHTFVRDLNITLRSPENTSINLSSDNGNDGDDYLSTLFDDACIDPALGDGPITNASAPFTGCFAPQGSLSSLIGQRSDGAWTLTIIDNVAEDIGTLHAWTLGLCINDIQENCQDGIDDDGDGDIDCADADCAADLFCNGQEDCDNGLDDDGDGDIDCADVKCDEDPACVAGFECGAGQTLLQISSTDIPKAIPDNNALGVNSVLNVFPTAPITRAMLQVIHLEHPFVGDLRLSLRSPQNTIVALSSNIGSNGDNYLNTLFDDACLDLGDGPITNASAPFTGCFAPQGSLSSLIGQPASGVWILNASDTALGDVGTLHAWTLNLCVGSPPPPPNN